MKLLHRLEAKILSLIPEKLRRSYFFLFGLLLLSFPVTILFAQQFQGNSLQRIASESVTPPGPPNENIFGKAASFSNATNETYIKNVYSSPSSLLPEVNTVEFWIKTEDLPKTGTAYNMLTILDKSKTDSGQPSCNLRFYHQRQPSGQNQIVANYVSYLSNGLPGPSVLLPANIPDEHKKWTHIAFTVSKTGATSTSQLFVNGKNKAKYTHKSGEYICRGGGIDLFVGAPQSANLFNGTVDEIRISTISRYSEEFTKPSLPYSTDNNTLLLWHLDGNVNDASGKNNNGQIYGNVNYIPSTIGDEPSPTQTPTCTPRPACLDLERNSCKIPEPATGWCPPNITATPTAPPIPNVAPKPLSASTQYVSIQADGFLINTGANGTYSTPTTFSDVNSDPPGGGDNNRTTLELTWFESGREMRMFMYFSENASTWKLDELRTYNGNVSGDWIYYTPQDNQGNPIQAPINSSYTNPGITLYGTNVPGSSVSFAKLNLRAFLNQATPTPEQCTPAQLTTYNLQNRCFFGGFKSAKITCNDGYTTTLSFNSCKSASSIYKEGINTCKNRCTNGENPQPTPVVTNTPKPTQTPTPTPRRRGWFFF